MNKVVLLIRNVAPEKYGGGESYQLELAEQLRKNGFCPIIATSSLRLLNEAKKRNMETIMAPYFRQQNWSGLKNLLFPVYYLWQVGLRHKYQKMFEQYRPEVVNIQSRDDWIAGTLAAKKYGIKVLWTDHIDFRTWVLTNVNIKYKNLIGKWVLRCAKKADKIIMISDFERKWFDKHVLPRKFSNVVTIKNGVRDEYAKYKNIEAEKNSFCYIGRLVDYKGISELIRAFDLVHKEISETKLNIYGDGKLKEYQTMAGEGVKFYGYTDEPLMAMAKNEIFVLPSYYEGLSISLLDAIMMKKEIIATKVDGNPEVVIEKETGLLVPPKNVTELAEAMMEMIRDKKAALRMSQNARKYYEKNYDFDEIFAKKMLGLYNNNKEKKMKILLTGGTGYIGSHTAVELIERGYEVEILDNLFNSKITVLDKIEKITGVKPKFYEVDLLDKKALDAVMAGGEYDLVIHFAGLKAVGESVEKPLKYYENNIGGTINLLESMKKYNVKKIVFSSSATVYGDQDGAKLTEEARAGVGITNPYGQTKYMIEQILIDVAKAEPDFEVTILRYFNPIGAHKSGLIGEDPNDIPNNLMPIIMKVSTGEIDKLTVFGDDYDTPDGTGMRDFIHVVDLAKGHVAVVEHMRPGVQVYNLGTGKATSVMEMVKAFEKESGKELPYEIAPRRAGDLAMIYADPTKAERELKWKAELDVQDAMKDTINYLKQFNEE